MTIKEVVFAYPGGFQDRAATKFIRKAGGFRSQVWLECNGTRINGKSLMSVLFLGVECQDTLRVFAEGSDEANAAESLASLIENNFDLGSDT